MTFTRSKFAMAMAGTALFVSLAGASRPAAAQECFIGEVRYFAGNFAPRGWAFTDGQLLPIAQHNALFSILGTIYGGDGRTTFALPDLRGRAAIGAGSGPGLQAYAVGAKGGAESHTLNVEAVQASGGSGTTVIGARSPVDVRSPYQALHPIICLQGIYPSRN